MSELRAQAGAIVSDREQELDDDALVPSHPSQWPNSARDCRRAPRRVNNFNGRFQKLEARGAWILSQID